MQALNLQNILMANPDANGFLELQLPTNNSELGNLAEQLGLSVDALEQMTPEELFAAILMQGLQEESVPNQAVSEDANLAGLDEADLAIAEESGLIALSPQTPLEARQGVAFAEANSGAAMLADKTQALFANLNKPPKMDSTGNLIDTDIRPLSQLLADDAKGALSTRDLFQGLELDAMVTDNNTIKFNPAQLQALVQGGREGQFHAQNQEAQPIALTNLPQGFAQLTRLPSGVVVPQIATPVDHAAWQDVFNQQVVMLGNQQVKQAAIRLNPPELGPIEVTIKLNQDHTSISFNAQHTQVRDAIEQAIPRLRELFNETGLNLADVNVSDDQSRFAQRESSPQEALLPFSNEGGDHEALTMDVAHPLMVKQGLVDIYA